MRAFNGTSGEWLCHAGSGKGDGTFVLRPEEQLALPQMLPDIDYLFAPLKHARLDYLAQKATEMGCRRLRPVFTERTHGRAGQYRAHEGQCHRGSRAVRHGGGAGGAAAGPASIRSWPIGRASAR